MNASKIGILTGGGDVPGLNSVIKSVVYRATEMGREVVGVRKGWEGLTHLNPSDATDPRYVVPLARIRERLIGAGVRFSTHPEPIHGRPNPQRYLPT